MFALPWKVVPELDTLNLPLVGSNVTLTGSGAPVILLRALIWITNAFGWTLGSSLLVTYFIDNIDKEEPKYFLAWSLIMLVISGIHRYFNLFDIIKVLIDLDLIIGLKMI